MMTEKTQVYKKNGITVTVFPYGNEFIVSFIVSEESGNSVQERHFTTRDAAISFCKSNALYDAKNVRTVANESISDKFRKFKEDRNNSIHFNPIDSESEKDATNHNIEIC